jgi:hypothetical protein
MEKDVGKLLEVSCLTSTLKDVAGFLGRNSAGFNPTCSDDLELFAAVQDKMN